MVVPVVLYTVSQRILVEILKCSAEPDVIDLLRNGDIVGSCDFWAPRLCRGLISVNGRRGLGDRAGHVAFKDVLDEETNLNCLP